MTMTHGQQGIKAPPEDILFYLEIM